MITFFFGIWPILPLSIMDRWLINLLSEFGPDGKSYTASQSPQRRPSPRSSARCDGANKWQTWSETTAWWRRWWAEAHSCLKHNTADLEQTVLLHPYAVYTQGCYTPSPSRLATFWRWWRCWESSASFRRSRSLNTAMSTERARRLLAK